MNKYYQPIFMTIITIAFMTITVMAFGWYMFLLGLGFLLSFIFQLMIIWSFYNSKGKTKKFLFLTFFIFMTFCLLREDGGDTSNSVINGLSVISHFFGFRETSNYEGSSDILSLINLLWIPFLGFQFYGYLKLKKTEA